MSNPRASSFAHLPPRPDIADDQNNILLALPWSWIKLRPHQPHRVQLLMLKEQPTSVENEKLQSSSVLQPHTPAMH